MTEMENDQTKKDESTPCGGDVGLRHLVRPCVTHHHACDCREQLVRDLEKDLRDTALRLELVTNMLARCEWWLSTIPEGRAMQMECRKVLSPPNSQAQPRQ
jgi:hypothetical protein